MLVLLLVASDRLRVGRAFSAAPPPFGALQTRRCTSSALLLPASTPRLAYKQKKGGGERPEESRSPQSQAGLAPPAALRTGALISGIQA